ncbi:MULTISPECIES: hypothetical protein [unclassified Acinetobacter]|uniref:hypothetical protein n=1 Tax=unclassified Acinetobacter TaxID=196816 RepID=UPI00190B5BD0|nr:MULTISPECIES: hypothetical protein [unclassified Acinetobacter]MBK0062599.1 hypothetical protein [Acinetobacter sp. S55]MBK0065824.1 hypothetical protein [Acinetobacter sp. S54]
MNNNSIYPYVPLTSRLVTSKQVDTPILGYFMTILDAACQKELDFNHTPEQFGFLSINPEQINDLANLTSLQPIDMVDLGKALGSLIYPVFRGETKVNSPLWNNEPTVVWQFQLNVMNSWNFKTMNNSRDKAVESFDQVLGMVRILRSSLEARHQDPEIILNANDLANVLLLIEEKLCDAHRLLEPDSGILDD